MLLLAGCGRGDEVLTTRPPPTQVRHDLGPLTHWLELAFTGPALAGYAYLDAQSNDLVLMSRM